MAASLVCAVNLSDAWLMPFAIELPIILFLAEKNFQVKKILFIFDSEMNSTAFLVEAFIKTKNWTFIEILNKRTFCKKIENYSVFIFSNNYVWQKDEKK